MRRVASWLAALAVALLCWVHAATPDAVAVTPPLPVHTYDSVVYAAPSEDSLSERGPPTNYEYVDHVTAVDHGSDGASGRPSASTTSARHDYDGTVLPVQADRATGTTGELVRATTGDLLALRSGQVAAKAGPSVLTRITNWSGREYKFGPNLRIAPFGNRTGHPTGRYPHYHRRVVDDAGETLPGQGIGRHRPWDTKSPDTSFWDRF